MLSKVVLSLLTISVGASLAAPIARFNNDELVARDLGSIDLDEMSFEKRAPIEDVTGEMDVFERGFGDEEDLETRSLKVSADNAQVNEEVAKAFGHREKQMNHLAKAAKAINAKQYETAKHHALESQKHAAKAAQHEAKADEHRAGEKRGVVRNNVHSALAKHHDGKADAHREKQASHAGKLATALDNNQFAAAGKHNDKVNHHQEKAFKHEQKAAGHRSKVAASHRTKRGVIRNNVHSALANHHDGRADAHRAKQMDHSNKLTAALDKNQFAAAGKHNDKVNHHQEKARVHDLKAAGHRSKVAASHRN